MKKFMGCLTVTLIIATVASISAFAKTRTEKVTFPSDIKVNGTVLAKGAYQVKFDDKSNELSILKGKKVVARATANLEQRGSKAELFEWRQNAAGSDVELVGITFAGTDQNINISNSPARR
jgi:hypothetical protein